MVYVNVKKEDSKIILGVKEGCPTMQDVDKGMTLIFGKEYTRRKENAKKKENNQ